MLNDAQNEGSYWFRRLQKDLGKISTHLRLKRIRCGFFRIYWKQAYIGECFKEMPQYGHDIYENNVHFMNKKYYEELEDKAEYVRKVKNFVEGYWEVLDRVKVKAWKMKHDPEFFKTATEGYKQLVVK